MRNGSNLIFRGKDNWHAVILDEATPGSRCSIKLEQRRQDMQQAYETDVLLYAYLAAHEELEEISGAVPGHR